MIAQRGRAKATIELIESAHDILAEIQPCGVRAVCYQLFIAGEIDSMAVKNTKRVSRILVEARRLGEIPWSWIVDRSRRKVIVRSWSNAEEFLEESLESFRRDAWEYQPHDIELWSEKATIQGTLWPVLSQYGVPFRAMGGFSSATVIHNVADAWRDKPLIVLYVGDYDPSGLYMSEVDLPERLAEYGANLSGEGPDWIELRRIALLGYDLDDLPSFDVGTKKKDARYRWYLDHTDGQRRAWELDAMDPRDLRDRVEDEIVSLIDPDAWNRCKRAEEAEQKSLKSVLEKWTGSKLGLDPERGGR